MSSVSIPHTRVPKSSALLLDYLYRFSRVAPFYSVAPFDSSALRTLAERAASHPGHRLELSEILARQNQAFGCGSETLGNIERLGRPGSCAVVTGQQVGLFSGPIFTLYKALTAIKVAMSLNEQGITAVPVFWLASEDHDLEEVAWANIFNEEYESDALGDAGERPASRCSVGYVKLSGQISATVGQLESLLPPGESRNRLISDLGECYRPGATWSQAFGRLMARLFRPWGVVLLDPLEEGIHRLSASVYTEAIARADELRRALAERSSALMKSGYHAQVHVAEDSTLVFAEREGSRLPLHHHEGQGENGYFFENGESYSLKELDEKIQAQPLSFSANVLLRPVVQDCLLPTIVCVAGPSELAYFGQAHALYAAFGRPMPAVVPRAGFTLLDARARRLMEKYRVSLEDVWAGREHLSGKIAAVGFAQGWSERWEQAEQELAVIMDRLRADVQTLDPTLLDALKHTEEKIKYQVERLKGKMTRAALGRSEVLRHHEELLDRFLMPHRELQEREVCGISFLGRAGYELLERILVELDVQSPDHHVIEI